MRDDDLTAQLRAQQAAALHAEYVRELARYNSTGEEFDFDMRVQAILQRGGRVGTA